MAFIPPATQHTFDSRPIPDITLDVLDMQKVAAHIAQARERERLQGSDDPEAYLREQGCVVTVDGVEYPTLAGVLCFGKAPQAIFPLAVVDLGHYYGTATLAHEVVHIERHIGGTIFDQLEHIERYLWANTHHGMTLSPMGMQRIEVHAYPRPAMRELTVNMLAHRDYAQYHSTARVQLLRNRIEWINPGGLPPSMGIQHLLSAQYARNPLILSILYEAGYVEAFGQGIDTVCALLEQEGMAQPRFEDQGSLFLATIYGRILEDADHTAATGASAAGALPAELAESMPRVLFTPSQKRIYERIQELQREGLVVTMASLQSSDVRSSRSILRDLEDLRDMGLIELEGQGRGAHYRLKQE
jgi:predicted HTH transcriptional regulator